MNWSWSVVLGMAIVVGLGVGVRVGGAIATMTTMPGFNAHSDPVHSYHEPDGGEI